METIRKRLFDKLSDETLREKANEIRRQVVEVSVKNGAGHIAPSLSCIDILTALYYNVMTFSDAPEWDDRDRLVFSKSHGCYGHYAILQDIGYIDSKDWKEFYNGSFLAGCSEQSVKHGLEAGCGALGHGLPMAVGIAFGAKLQNKAYRTYCIMGDGEMQEGSNWEAIQFAVKHNLSNLTVIIDANGLQAMDFLENILTVKDRKDDLFKKMAVFGFQANVCDGHDPSDIISSINAWVSKGTDLIAPQALIANTIKGYGLTCMENVPKFHFRIPDADELKMGNCYDKR